MEENQEISNNSDAMRQAIHRAFEGLEKKDFYTVEEAANILLRSPVSVKQAVRRGELKGLILDHQVICISREALLEWLRTRPKL